MYSLNGFEASLLVVQFQYVMFIGCDGLWGYFRGIVGVLWGHCGGIVGILWGILGVLWWYFRGIVGHFRGIVVVF